MKKCLYCSQQIDDGSVIDFCERCGIQTFGRKMFDTIRANMEDARDRQDLLHTRADQIKSKP